MSFANPSEKAWRSAPTTAGPPAPDEVIVWRIALEAVTSKDEHELSSDERERADRFKFAHVRRAFVQGRLFLRRALAQITGCPAAEIQFISEGNGKPALLGRPLAFNLSHSGGAALLAVAGAGPVGVDVELMRETRDLIGLARRYFAATEYEELIRLEANDQTAAFYRCWTRKEAFIKALGEGLSHPLDSFAVRFAPEAPAEFTTAKEREEGWRIFDLDVGDGFAGAVVTPGSVERLTCFTLHQI